MSREKYVIVIICGDIDDTASDERCRRYEKLMAPAVAFDDLLCCPMMMFWRLGKPAIYVIKMPFYSGERCGLCRLPHHDASSSPVVSKLFARPVALRHFAITRDDILHAMISVAARRGLIAAF